MRPRWPEDFSVHRRQHCNVVALVADCDVTAFSREDPKAGPRYHGGMCCSKEPRRRSQGPASFGMYVSSCGVDMRVPAEERR